jgi:chitin disaccharide deacetylase
MTRRLVISSDDLGMSESVNRGIRAAADRGVLTSTNLMVPCPWFEQGAALLRDSAVDLGVHLTLTAEWDHYKWRPLSSGASLRNADGYCHQSIAELMARARPDELAAEMREQIAHAGRRGVNVAYVDLHMCIPYLDTGVLANTAEELALMRLVDAAAREFGLEYPYALAGNALRHFASALSISGKSRELIGAWLDGLGEGVHHLSCHCALDGEEMRAVTPRDNANYPWALDYRLEDLACLTSPWFQDKLRANRIELARMPFLR